MDSEADWLAERRKHVMSSDIADLFGLGFNSPLHVAMTKCGLLPPKEATAPMKWGKRLEDVIAEAYQEETGRAVLSCPGHPWPLIEHGEEPWAGATPDRIDVNNRVIELKTARTAQGWGKAGTDEIPEAYRIQVEWQMWVMSSPFADVAVLIAGSDFRVYHVEQNRAILDPLIERGRQFWTNLEQGIMPAPDYRDARTPDLLRALHGLDASEVKLAGEAEKWAQQYRDAKAGEKVGAELAAEMKCRILEAMGSASLARLPDGSTIRRRVVNVPTAPRKGYQFEGFYPRWADGKDGCNDLRRSASD